MKACSKCGETKAISEFFRNKSKRDGLATWCKACMRRYEQSDSGKVAKRRYEKSDKGKVVKSRHNQSGKGKATFRRARANNPRKTTARDAVNNAVKSGGLPGLNTLNCACCPAQAEQYHHPDYSKPLDVIPLCIRCHTGVHVQITVSPPPA